MRDYNENKAMSHKLNLTADPSEANPNETVSYQIRVKGHLGEQWKEWFEGLTLTPQANGDTLLIGPVVDQAALFGLLKKVRDLGLPLLSLNSLEPQKETNT